MLGAKEAVCGCAGSQDGAFKGDVPSTLHFLVQAVELTWGISWTAMEMSRLAMLFSDEQPPDCS